MVRLVMENAKFILVKYYDDWADEFGVHGFIALLEEEWEVYKLKLKEVFGNKSFTYFFGTNEEITYHTIDELFNRFKVTNISQTEYDFLLKSFGQLHLDDFDGENSFKVNKRIVEHGHIPYMTNDWLKNYVNDKQTE